MIGWLDVRAGASGDMLLGALVGAGVDPALLQQAVDALHLPEPVTLRVTATTRAALAATRVEVDVPVSRTLRHLADVVALMMAADLPAPVTASAIEVFDRLARAEATVHGSTPDQVHFHEVGALDALADITAVCAGVHSLGLSRLVASPVALGNGVTRGAHGPLPVPAPAVLALLTEAGAPVFGGPAEHEACTPTGAALLATLAAGWGPLPAMTISRTGVGAGGRDSGAVANVARLVLGTAVAGTAVDADGGAEAAVVLAANVDDLDPRVWPAVLARLLDAGAADAWLTPILMKKGRPAHTLSVLCAPEQVEGLRRVVHAETSTIGLRESAVTKRPLAREVVSVQVGGQAVAVKLARLDGRVVNIQPEYDDVLAAANALGRPVREVLAQASAAAQPDSSHT